MIIFSPGAPSNPDSGDEDTANTEVRSPATLPGSVPKISTPLESSGRGLAASADSSLNMYGTSVGGNNKDRNFIVLEEVNNVTRSDQISLSSPPFVPLTPPLSASAPISPSSSILGDKTRLTGVGDANILSPSSLVSPSTPLGSLQGGEISYFFQTPLTSPPVGSPGLLSPATPLGSSLGGEMSYSSFHTPLTSPPASSSFLSPSSKSSAGVLTPDLPSSVSSSVSEELSLLMAGMTINGADSGVGNSGPRAASLTPDPQAVQVVWVESPHNFVVSLSNCESLGPQEACGLITTLIRDIDLKGLGRTLLWVCNI